MILHENYDLIEATLDSLAAGVAILDRSGAIAVVNGRWQDLAGKGLLLTENVGVGANLLEILNNSNSDLREIIATITRACGEIMARSRREFELEYNIRERDWFSVRLRSLPNNNHNLPRLAIAIENITKYKQKEIALSSIVQATSGVTGQDFFRILVENLAKLLRVKYVFITEGLDNIKPVVVRILAFWCKNEWGENFEYSLNNSPCARVFGTEAKYYDRDLQILFPRDRDLILLEVSGYIGVPMFDSSGRVRGHLLAMDDNPIENPNLGLSLMQIFAPRSAVELARQRKQEQLIQDALRDRLTNLPNRALFLDRLTVAFKRFQRNEKDRFAVLLLNLDSFEVFRTRLGVQMAENLKVEIVKRIQSCLRNSDTFASLEGERFAILLEEIDTIADAAVVVDRIQQMLVPPFYLGTNEIFTSATIGVILSDSSFDSPDAFLCHPHTVWHHFSKTDLALRPNIKPVGFSI